MRVTNLLVAFIGIAAAPAQVFVAPNARSTQPAPAGKPGTVEGAVTNSVSGGPIKKAALMLHNMRQGFAYAAESDASGHFHFDSVQPDNYNLSVECPGYNPVPQNYTAYITVGDEQHVKDISIKLSPLGIVTGKVVDENGDPLASVRIQAFRYTYQMNGPRLTPMRSAATDDRGLYRLFDLQPGKYYIQASLPHNSNAGNAHQHTDRPAEAYLGTYFPGVPEIAAATPTDVKPGSEIPGIDFRLHKVRVFHIRGMAIDAQTQQPVHGNGVQLQECAPGAPYGNFISGAPLQPDGSFDFAGVEPGSYCLLIQSFQARQSAFARQMVNVSDHDPEPVTLALRPSVELRGTVVLDGTPPQNFRLSRIAITPVDGVGPTPNSAIQADNSFVLENVLPVAYELQSLNSGPGVYLKSARLGDQDVTDGLLNVTSAANLTLVLGTDPGKLDVTVQAREGSPATGALVLAVPADGREHRQDLNYIALVRSTASIPNMAPGRYRIYAVENGVDLGLVRSREMLKLLENYSTTVDISSSGHDTVTAQLIATEKIDEAKSKLH